MEQKNRKRKTPEIVVIPGFFDDSKLRLTLAELGSATCSLEAVLLTFFHSGVTGKESCLFKLAAKLRINIEQSAGDAVTDGACLTCEAAAINIYKNIKLAECIGELEGITNDHLEGLISEIIVDVPLIDCDNAGSGNEANSGNRLFTSACTKILCNGCHKSFPPPNYLSTRTSGF